MIERELLSSNSYRFSLTVCCLLGFASYVASYMRIPVVPLFAKELGADPVMVGLINSTFLLTTGICAFPLGMVADRYGRRPLIHAGLLLSLVTALLLAVSHFPWHLLLIYIFFGLGLAAIGPTLMAYVADISPSTHLGRSYGAYTLAIYSGMSLGPALGGLISQWLGFRLLFVASAALTGLITWLAWIFLPESGAASHPAAAPVSASSRQRLLRNRPLWGCWTVTLGGCFGLGMFITFAPLFLQAQHLHVGRIGLIFGLQAAVNALSRIPLGRLSDRLNRRWLLATAGFLTLSGALALFGLSRSFSQFLLTSGLLGFAMGLGFTPLGALIAEVVPTADRGLAMGGYNTCIYVGMMLSSALMGGIISRRGFGAGYLLAALVVALATGIFLLLIRERDSRK
uniref:MFS transporter n=1 Tax=Desulfobacca acetoxidans TaxID=60893 RepID=A0A7C5AMX3_9BACT